MDLTLWRIFKVKIGGGFLRRQERVRKQKHEQIIVYVCNKQHHLDCTLTATAELSGWVKDRQV